ncbi:MAG TPA: hypothetical protein VFU63_12765 [Ktedonobacterales bacterium]|nr:hypothetical protein [Ktedonobacterales bacterium]
MRSSIHLFATICHVTGGALITETDETDAARYFALDALPANTFLEYTARARDAAQGMPQTILRIPTGLSSREQRDGRRG